MKRMVNAVYHDEATLPDEDIIRRIVAGEKNLYELLMRRYNQRMYRISLSLLSDSGEAEEAMHVAYIHAFESLPRFEFRSAFATWLTRILIHECQHALARKKKSLPMRHLIIDEHIMKKSSKPFSPLSALLNLELRKHIEEAISHLPEKYRTVFVMREIEKMNVAETQACLDLSEENVKVRLNRAKIMLRDSLSQIYKQEDIMEFHLSRCDRMIDRVFQDLGLMK